MNRYIVILSLGIVLWFASGVSSDTVRGSTAPPPRKAGEEKAGDDRLCVTIWPRKTRVQIDEHFEVLLRVVNATEKPQSIWVLSDWGIGWKADNPRMTWHPPGGGISSRRVTIKLEPGEAYEKTMPMSVKDGPALTIISFRMGFMQGEETYWSNRVFLGIKPGKVK